MRFFGLRAFATANRRTSWCSVFAGVGGYARVEQFTDGFAAGMGAVTVFAVVGMVIALGMPVRHNKEAVDVR